ncbi:MAG: UbiX family flavin prenyltransferase [Peptococcaceae bacterium]|nr:UbiX family flavin prenyltransferase [Peptococcaceae bacterium]
MRIIVGISGASGAIYGIRLLEVLALEKNIETHLVISRAAEITIAHETSYDLNYVRGLARKVYGMENIGAPIASGSFQTDGMIIAPCSVKTLSAIANSYNDNLMVRAADVVLKERRKLVLLVRETPLHLGHIRLMEQVTMAGGILMPPVPAFYHRPKELDDIINQTVGKALDLVGVPHQLFRRWKGLDEKDAMGE